MSEQIADPREPRKLVGNPLATSNRGKPEYKNVFHLSASADPPSFMRLSTHLYWITVDNFRHASGVSTSGFQATVSITLHRDF